MKRLCALLACFALTACVEQSSPGPASPATNNGTTATNAAPGSNSAPQSPDEEDCRTVSFLYQNADARSVWITGSFTNWAGTVADGAIPMERGSGSLVDTWKAEIAFDDPGQYQYKFVVDASQWVDDPRNPMRADDGFGGTNSVLDVCDGSTTPDETVDPPAACEDFDWRDAVMYFAMVDRFHDSDGVRDPVEGVTDGDAWWGPSGQYMGGDLAGVTDKLGYLQDLGVSALWISAPYESRNYGGSAIDPGADPHIYSGYHGYWPSPDNVDFDAPGGPNPRPRVESRIGSEADLRELVDTAHGTTAANGTPMKVLFDYVMNHVDIASGLYQAHPEWFATRDGQFAVCGRENLWNDAYWGTRCAFTDYLPPFDFDNEWARRWSVADAMWWAKEFDLDGFRLDAIKHVSDAWLTDLRARLNAEFPDRRFYLVGETFAYDDRDLLRAYVDPASKLDGQFDFPFKARLCEAVFTPGGRMDDFAGWMADNEHFYGPDAIMTTWIGNHDVPRPIHFASREIGDCRAGTNPGNSWYSDWQQPGDPAAYERLSVAFAIMMTGPGIPLIYYGDEIGLAGGGDPDNRRMMRWNDDDLSDAQKGLRARVRSLARMRGEHPVFGRGARETTHADQDTWVVRIRGCGEPDIVVAINRADDARSIPLPADAWTDLESGESVDGSTWNAGPRTFRVLQVRR